MTRVSKFFVIPLTSKNVNLRATTNFQIDSADPAIVVWNKFDWFRWSFLCTFPGGKHSVDCRSQSRGQVRETLFTTQVEMDCYGNNFPCLPRCKRLAADRHVIADFSLVPFVIINLTRLTVGVCMKVRFTSKVTRGFSFSSRRFATRFRRFAALMRRKIKKNLWDQGKPNLVSGSMPDPCKTAQLTS